MIGILTTATIALINPAQQLGKSRDSKRKADLEQIRAALELYRADCGSYPAHSGNRVFNPLNSDSPVSSGTSTCVGANVTYMQTVPTDPKPPAAYVYANTGSGYTLTVDCLEAKGSGPGTFTNASCSSGLGYRVTNP